MEEIWKKITGAFTGFSMPAAGTGGSNAGLIITGILGAAGLLIGGGLGAGLLGTLLIGGGAALAGFAATGGITGLTLPGTGSENQAEKPRTVPKAEKAVTRKIQIGSREIEVPVANTNFTDTEAQEKKINAIHNAKIAANDRLVSNVDRTSAHQKLNEERKELDKDFAGSLQQLKEAQERKETILAQLRERNVAPWIIALYPDSKQLEREPWIKDSTIKPYVLTLLTTKEKDAEKTWKDKDPARRLFDAEEALHAHADELEKQSPALFAAAAAKRGLVRGAWGGDLTATSAVRDILDYSNALIEGKQPSVSSFPGFALIGYNDNELKSRFDSDRAEGRSPQHTAYEMMKELTAKYKHTHGVGKDLDQATKEYLAHSTEIARVHYYIDATRRERIELSNEIAKQMGNLKQFNDEVEKIQVDLSVGEVKKDIAAQKTAGLVLAEEVSSPVKVFVAKVRDGMITIPPAAGALFRIKIQDSSAASSIIATALAQKIGENQYSVVGYNLNDSKSETDNVFKGFPKDKRLELDITNPDSIKAFTSSALAHSTYVPAEATDVERAKLEADERAKIAAQQANKQAEIDAKRKELEAELSKKSETDIKKYVQVGTEKSYKYPYKGDTVIPNVGTINGPITVEAQNVENNVSTTHTIKIPVKLETGKQATFVFEGAYSAKEEQFVIGKNNRYNKKMQNYCEVDGKKYDLLSSNGSCVKLTDATSVRETLYHYRSVLPREISLITDASIIDNGPMERTDEGGQKVNGHFVTFMKMYNTNEKKTVFIEQDNDQYVVTHAWKGDHNVKTPGWKDSKLNKPVPVDPAGFTLLTSDIDKNETKIKAWLSKQKWVENFSNENLPKLTEKKANNPSSPPARESFAQTPKGQQFDAVAFLNSVVTDISNGTTLSSPVTQKGTDINPVVDKSRRGPVA